MIEDSRTAEAKAALCAARHICAAARTAPKTKGVDNIVTAIVTGEDKDKLAAKMRELSENPGRGFFARDAGNVDKSEAVVLIGVKEAINGLNCGLCHFPTCKEALEKGSWCAFNNIDLGIAIGSAAARAADMRVDSRVMYSVGSTALVMGLLGDDVKNVMGLPISVSGKSPYFDRK